MPGSVCVGRRQVSVRHGCDRRGCRRPLDFADGSRTQSDSDEWIKVDGSHIAVRNGNLSLRFGEPMEEINYIDQLRLVAVDHPKGTDVYPDERFLSETPFASAERCSAFGSASAGGCMGRRRTTDVLRDCLRIATRSMCATSKLSAIAGFANAHTLTLDLGEWSAESPLRLFLTASSNTSARARCTPPGRRASRRSPQQSRRRCRMGAGRGSSTTWAFRRACPARSWWILTGKLPPQTARIRIRTNLQIYWDQVLVDNGPDATERTRQTEMPLASASLAFRGYPQQIDGATPGDLTYDYQSISTTGPFQWQRGSYTRYGDVTPLLQAIGRPVRHLRQRRRHRCGVQRCRSSRASAELEARLLLLRRWFRQGHGFLRGAALHRLADAVPWHEHLSIPTERALSGDASTLDYRLDWNDRFETGDRTQMFQFHYAPTTSEPVTP